MRLQGFCGPSYVAASLIADAERCVNLFPSVLEVPNAKAHVVLDPAPGYQRFLSLPHYPIRGVFTQNGRAFAAAGTVLHEAYTDGTSTARSGAVSLANDDAPVTIASNGDGGNQLFLTSGSKGYCYDLAANTLTQVLSAANFGGFLGGFFVALDLSTGQLRISDLEDGSTWDPVLFEQRTRAGDTWKALIIAHDVLWLFGSQTSEGWYNAGATPFPLLPIDGAFFNQGIAAPYSLALLDNAPVWLSANDQGAGMVLRLGDGFTPARISNHALEHAMRGYSTLADAIGWTYQEDGHAFYVLTFPSADATWVYDVVASGQLGFPCWHERGEWDSNANAFTRVRGQFHMFAFGKHLTGDRITGDLYDTSLAYATDASQRGIRRLRRAPHVNAERARLCLQRFELDVETGVGLNALTQGHDPSVALRVSKDGGRTWGVERTRALGKQGVYRQRVQWMNLGMARDAVLEVTCADPVPVRLIDAYLELEGVK